MNAFKAFVAGFLSTLVFHQGMLSLLYTAGAFPRAPYPMGATWPFGIPQVISLAFWGGLWGIVLWPLIRNAAPWRYWSLALVIGALAPSAVALFIVFPLKGQPVAGGWNPMVFVGAMLLNGAWGIGVAAFCRLFGMGRRRA